MITCSQGRTVSVCARAGAVSARDAALRYHWEAACVSCFCTHMNIFDIHSGLPDGTLRRPLPGELAPALIGPRALRGH